MPLSSEVVTSPVIEKNEMKNCVSAIVDDLVFVVALQSLEFLYPILTCNGLPLWYSVSVCEVLLQHCFHWLDSRIFLFLLKSVIWLWGGSAPFPWPFLLTLILYIFHLYMKVKFNPCIYSRFFWTKMLAKEASFIPCMIYYIIPGQGIGEQE